MKTNWQTKKLGEACDFYNGLWKGKEPPYIEVGVIRNTNFTKEGKLDDSDIAYLDVEKKQFEKRRLIYGDIILEKSGGGPKQPVGRVIIFDKKVGNFSFSNFTSAIRVKNGTELDFNFLHNFLFFSYISGITESMQSHSTGIRNLDLNAYKGIEISLPPLPEQKRIVKILDEVFEKTARAKENAEKNLQNAKELFESYLQSIFKNPGKNWEVCELNAHVKFIDYRGRTPKKTPSGLRLITAKNIKMGFLQRNPEEFIDPKDYNGWMTRGIPKKGDVLFTTEAPLAMVAQLDTDEKVAFAQRTIIFQANPTKIYSTFLKYLLISSPIQKRIIEKGTGATVQGIKASLLKKIEIYFPKSLPEQKAIVKKLDALSAETKKLETIYKQKLADLEELKKSILKKAFNGEL
jgi:type I restriction enzyme S subunit